MLDDKAYNLALLNGELTGTVMDQVAAMKVQTVDGPTIETAHGPHDRIQRILSEHLDRATVSKIAWALEPLFAAEAENEQPGADRFMILVSRAAETVAEFQKPRQIIDDVWDDGDTCNDWSDDDEEIHALLAMSREGNAQDALPALITDGDFPHDPFDDDGGFNSW